MLMAIAPPEAGPHLDGSAEHTTARVERAGGARRRALVCVLAGLRATVRPPAARARAPDGRALSDRRRLRRWTARLVQRVARARVRNRSFAGSPALWGRPGLMVA